MTAMTVQLFSLLIIGIAFGLIGVYVQTEPVEIKVCSVNVLHEKYYSKYSTVQRMNPAVRLDLFEEWLTREGSLLDIIAMQEFPYPETEYNNQDWIITVEKWSKTYNKTILRDPKVSSVGLLLIISNNIKVVEHNSYSFPDSGKSKRYSHTTIRLSGKEILVINAHVPWNSNPTESHKFIRNMIPQSTLVIALGDWNTELSTSKDKFAALPASFTDVTSEVGSTCISPTGISQRLDYITIGEGIKGSDCEVFPKSLSSAIKHSGTPPHYDNWFSDHLSVKAVLSIR